MFLPVKRPDCSDALDRLTEMVNTILVDATRSMMPEEVDLSALEAAVSPELRDLFGYKKVCEAVRTLYQLPYMERLRIQEAFQNDIAFHHHIEDEEYQLSKLSDLPKAGGKALKTLCTALYDLVSMGVPTKGPAEGRDFSSQLLRRQFKKVNGSFGRVCPVCICETLFDIREGKGDHYFPKAKYPALTFHPDNLLPVCNSCNDLSVKGAQDPVDARDTGAGELRTVFLPYLRAAKNEVELDVDEDCGIIIRPGSGGNEWTARRIENMDRLYLLSRRWSGVLEDVWEDVSEYARQQCAGYGNRQEKIDTLRDILAGITSGTRNRTDFIKGVYCAWLLEKSDQELEKMLLYSSLDLSEASSGT